MMKYSAHMEHSEWTLYRSPAETWEAMYDDCLQARISIEFEQYIFQNDALGGRFLRLFLRKAKEGVAIRLLLDRVGSRSLYQSRKLALLRRYGVRVVFFNAVKGWRRFRLSEWYPRTHAKLMLIDSAIAYAGGVCFDASMAHWRDTHMRSTGAVVQEICAAFNHTNKRFFNLRARRATVPLPRCKGDIHFEISRKRRERNGIYHEMLNHFSKASQSIEIVSPYFIPNRKLIYALIDARQRGVRVRVMLSEKTDSLLADIAIRRYLPALLEAGVEVHYYLPVPHHAKIVLVDDAWATLGSMNLDYLSLFRNRESNYLITDKALIAALRKDFQEDLKKCSRMTLAKLAKQPFYYHPIGWATHMLRGFM
ncbi:hypothetical protein GC177_06210 [bacterium]|nr:hypothetical protein [bacterium]